MTMFLVTVNIILTALVAASYFYLKFTGTSYWTVLKWSVKKLYGKITGKFPAT
jgi:hypothetical protein